MKVLSSLAALSLMVSASGCATPIPTFYPQGFPQKPEASDIDQIRTTDEGNILFRQKLFAGNLARLDADVIVKPYSAFRREHVVPKGTVLQHGIMVDTEHDGDAWCTLELTSTVHSLVGETAKGRSCFVDTDKSGKFNVVFAKGLEWQVPSWVTVRNKQVFTPLTSGTVDGAISLDPPAPYTKTNDPLEVDSEFALRYVPDNKGPALLEMIQVKNGFEEELLFAKVRVPPSNTLPQTLDVRGVKIEVISHQDGVMKYRIVSGLNTEEPITLDLN